MALDVTMLVFEKEDATPKQACRYFVYGIPVVKFTQAAQ
jgi:hypothetical protein